MILLPLLVEVEQKIAKIESQGVIYKVNQPTPLCAGMVAVPKKSSAIQICVDLKWLNQCVMRELHPLVQADNTLAKLSGAKFFSKLDANSGFGQIPLSQISWLLTHLSRHSGNSVSANSPLELLVLPNIAHEQYPQGNQSSYMPNQWCPDIWQYQRRAWCKADWLIEQNFPCRSDSWQN